MYFLAIETSCDETSIAILEGSTANTSSNLVDYINSFAIKANIVSSQIEIHAEYGGVIPELGARHHAEQIHDLFQKALDEANIGMGEIDQIFVTSEPGLISALRVGMEFAKTIQFFIGQLFDKSIEITKINHLRGHAASCLYNASTGSELFPHLHLLVSGGNSQILLLNSWHDWKIIGQTLDDAAGECFDKIARMLGLPYPGGVYIGKIAGLEENNYFDFPISMQRSNDYNYSFSGLKTAVRYFVQKQNIPSLVYERKLSTAEIDILINNNLDELNEKLQFVKKACISTQTVIIKQLTSKIKLAKKEFNPNSIGLSGGVSASQVLRNNLQKLSNNILLPPLDLTTDNAAMIAMAGIADTFDK